MKLSPYNGKKTRDLATVPAAIRVVYVLGREAWLLHNIGLVHFIPAISVLVQNYI